MNAKHSHDVMRLAVEREAAAHEFFAANPDVHMTPGDHARRGQNLRDIGTALAALCVPTSEGDEVIALLIEAGYLAPDKATQARRIVQATTKSAPAIDAVDARTDAEDSTA